MKLRCAWLSIFLAVFAVTVVFIAFAQTAGSQSLIEINKQLSNTISSIFFVMENHVSARVGDGSAHGSRISG
jgi:hypothetical protein